MTFFGKLLREVETNHTGTNDEYSHIRSKGLWGDVDWTSI
jgi:hypothetical protein